MSQLFSVDYNCNVESDSQSLSSDKLSFSLSSLDDNNGIDDSNMGERLSYEDIEIKDNIADDRNDVLTIETDSMCNIDDLDGFVICDMDWYIGDDDNDDEEEEEAQEPDNQSTRDNKNQSREKSNS